MIYTKDEFLGRLLRMKTATTTFDYNRAIDDVLNLIASEGACFRE